MRLPCGANRVEVQAVFRALCTESRIRAFGARQQSGKRLHQIPRRAGIGRTHRAQEHPRPFAAAMGEARIAQDFHMA